MKMCLSDFEKWYHSAKHYDINFLKYFCGQGLASALKNELVKNERGNASAWKIPKPTEVHFHRNPRLTHVWTKSYHQRVIVLIYVLACFSFYLLLRIFYLDMCTQEFNYQSYISFNFIIITVVMPSSNSRRLTDSWCSKRP